MQSFRSGIRTRLTTKPGVSWQRIGVFPIRSPNANAVSNGLVLGQLGADDLDERHQRRRVEEVHPDDALRRRRSRRRSRSPRARRCWSRGRRPAGRSGRARRRAPASARAPRRSPRSRGRSRRSRRARSSARAGSTASSRAACSSCPFSVLRVRKWPIRSRACSPSSAVTSRPTVSTPASTQSCAIPAPMAPSPTTPTLRTSTARDPTDAALAAGLVEARVGAVEDGERADPARMREDERAMSCPHDRRLALLGQVELLFEFDHGT